MKLLIISHSLIQRAAQTRWRRMAATYPDMMIRVLIPGRWVIQGFGKRIVYEGQDERVGNFEVRTVAATNYNNESAYFIRGLAGEIRRFRPDVIFPVHESFQTVQTIIWKSLTSWRSRLLLFTMNAHPRVTRVLPTIRPKKFLLNLMYWFNWAVIRCGVDAAMCHYPGIERRIRSDGFRRPILIQTQIGVDEEVFHPDPVERQAVRERLGLDGFVVGTAGRITADKGVLDLGEAITRMPGDTRLLVIGDGPDRGKLEETARRGRWHERLHITGFVPLNEVAHLMRGMDCFVLGSRTTPTWTDTFPLVVAQAMATGLPVVGSDSGALPFQLGGRGLVFPEGDVDAIATHLHTLHDNAALRARMGHALLERAREEFCIGGINPKLRDFIATLTQRLA